MACLVQGLSPSITSHLLLESATPFGHVLSASVADSEDGERSG